MVTIILPKLPHTHTHCLSACVHCYPLTCNGPVLGVHWTSSETWSSQKQSPQWLWDWSTDRLASSKSHGSETPGKPSPTRMGKKQSFLLKTYCSVNLLGAEAEGTDHKSQQFFDVYSVHQKLSHPHHTRIWPILVTYLLHCNTGVRYIHRTNKS